VRESVRPSVRPSVLSFFGFSFMVLKDMMRSTKVLRRQLLVDDTKTCSPMSGIETSFSSLFVSKLVPCAFACFVSFLRFLGEK